MTKAYFIAPSHQQAAFWAAEMGYGRGEWRFLFSEHDYRGRFPSELPVFRVGDPSCEPSIGAAGVEYLLACGQEVIYPPERWS